MRLGTSPGRQGSQATADRLELSDAGFSGLYLNFDEIVSYTKRIGRFFWRDAAGAPCGQSAAPVSALSYSPR